MHAITLSHDEVEAVTGYKRPNDQLVELQRRGFARARLSPTTGKVILERAHYESVCGGQQATRRPQVRPPQLRSA